ncbi:DNA-binding Lrp family transcriptional regulator [Microbacterium halimionae]|uniref:DNA-binding Lrp family transcriptional regulator n=1 Tax=Microbacterium halimionae TaxID=1526413 RepID=A0A7W3JLN7_9MICO|nr:Lrp/AsnC family transcriptional regulator [Microbacterium halimionae]MBA8815071.1 DNA-binding Lrp family transcriptional regulator [Microbacterium halimionae]NII94138.1 DNA-binding Lrp family transcriptional regulator [Microbacterium halimionae]
MVAKEPRSEAALDETDRAVLAAVQSSARSTNREIAARAGVAESTAHVRLRGLERRGVVAGYEAVISQHELGQTLQALVGVTLRPGARQASIARFSEDTGRLPEVTQMFFVGGVDDFIVHVAVEDSSALRRFVVEHLSGHDSVASTRTSVIFEYTRNQVAASFH